MGFGGGSLGGGGSFGGGGSYSSFDTYSSSSYSGGSTSKGGKLFLGVMFLVMAAIFGGVAALMFWVVFGDGVPLAKDYCVGATSLNPGEQLWCTSNLTTNMTANVNKTCINLYRAKKSDLPNITHRIVKIHETLSVSSFSYKFYSFVMMAGSNVTAQIESTRGKDDCYFMTSTDFAHFLDEDATTTYILKSKGTLIVQYNIRYAGTYYFVVSHSSTGKVSATFNMDFAYAVYNMSSWKSDSCSDSKCLFNETKPNEMLIADNHCEEECEAELLLSEKVNIVFIVMMSILILGPFSIGTIGLLVASLFNFFTYLIHKSFKKTDRHVDHSSTLEDKKTPLLTTSGSTETPTAGGTDEGSSSEKPLQETSSSISYVNDAANANDAPSYDFAL